MKPTQGPAGPLGASLVEALVAIVLAALLVQLAWSAAAATRRSVTRLLERSEALDTERVGWHVLSSEVGSGLAARDWSVEQEKVLLVRAFRGTGEVCPAFRTSAAALVRYGGVRAPDPLKDSLLVLSEAGVWGAVKLVSREGTSLVCPGWSAPVLERWRWDPPLEGALLARVFERGSYHLEDGAVRYRTGQGGRQPLTPERVRDDGSSFAVHDGALELRLRVRAGEGEGADREWVRRLAQGAGLGG